VIKILVTLLTGAIAAVLTALLHDLITGAVIAGVTVIAVLAMLALSMTVGVAGIRRLLRR
jgi:hypothetical protein